MVEAIPIDRLRQAAILWRPAPYRAADAAPAKTAADPTRRQPPAIRAKEADEKAIRATADEFVKAFNAADAKAIGALWAPDAEYTDESGESFQGRAAIEQVYADLFKQHLGAMMTVKIESIRLLGPDVALEKGVARVKSPGGLADTAARYTVVHAKRNGKWTMVFGRDAPYVPASNEDYLKDLEWFIGDWNPEAKELPLRLHFEWMAQRNFIKNTYTVTKDGQVHVDRRPDHRLESQAGAHRLLALRRPGRLRRGRVDERRLEMGHRGHRRAARRQRKHGGQHRDSHRRQQLHLAVDQADSGRRKPSRYAARQDRSRATGQMTSHTEPKRPMVFRKVSPMIKMTISCWLELPWRCWGRRLSMPAVAAVPRRGEYRQAARRRISRRQLFRVALL